jgi:hypothetical protein
VLSVAVEGKEVLSPHIWMGFRLGSFAQATDLVVKKAVVERGGLLTAVAFVHSKGQSSAGRQCSGGVKHQKENMLQNDDDDLISCLENSK